MDDFTKPALRQKVHSMIRCLQIDTPEDRIYPTVKAIHHELSKDVEFPKMKITTLRKILKRMGFRFMTTKASRNSMLVEKSGIVELRREFIRKVRKYREEQRDIYYCDESYVHQGRHN